MYSNSGPNLNIYLWTCYRTQTLEWCSLSRCDSKNSNPDLSINSQSYYWIFRNYSSKITQSQNPQMFIPLSMWVQEQIVSHSCNSRFNLNRIKQLWLWCNFQNKQTLIAQLFCLSLVFDNKVYPRGFNRESILSRMSIQFLPRVYYR